MRIAVDARFINSSTGRYVERLLHYLQIIDSDNTYLVLVRASDAAYWTPTNPNFSVVVADYKYYSFAEQLGFLRFLDGLNADLVHFALPQQPVLYGGAHVTTVHDLTLLNTYNSDKNWLVYHAKQLVGRYVFRSVARSSQVVLTPSEYTKQAIIAHAGITPDKVTVTYEAADPIAGDPEPYRLPSPEFLLYVGQQSDYKNIRRLILAHQKLLAAHPRLHLVLAGSKNAALRANEDWAARNNYQQIIFTGFVSDSQLLWLYRNAACYVFPSLMEGFGLPGLEAMRAGAPVASSDATCLPEIYGDAAHYFNPKDTTDMTDKIDQVLTDPGLRDRLVAAGSKKVAGYSWERMARQTLAAYLEAAEPARE